MSSKIYGLFLSVVLILFFVMQGCTEASPVAVPTLVEPKVTAALLSQTLTPTLTFVAVSPYPPSTPKQAEAGITEADLSQRDVVHEWTSTSPDKKWIASGLVAFPKRPEDDPLAYVRLLVSSADGKTNWTIVDELQEMGLGFPMPDPLNWSGDGESFYFTHLVRADGCSVFPFLIDLYQFNIGDGAIYELLPPSVNTLALSPDESQVAYIDLRERGLVIRDLLTGEEREIKIDLLMHVGVGNLLWSLDGKAVAFTVAINPCSGDYDASRTIWAESTSIIWVEVKTLEKRILVDEDNRLFITHEWTEDDQIVLKDGRDNDLWDLDVNTGDISKQ